MSSESAISGAHCPFCNRSISEELASFGGRCLHCFGEIPGEDTPTDPGEGARKADMRVAAKQAKKNSKLMSGALVALMLIAVTFALVLVTRPKPTPILNLDLDEYALGDLGEIVAKPQTEVPSLFEGTAASGARRVSRRSSHSGSAISALAGSSTAASAVSGGASDGAGVDVRLADGAGGGAAMGLRSISGGDASAGTDVRIAPILGNSGGGLAGFEAVSIGVQRRDQVGVVLVDGDSIIDMVKLVVTEELPKLRSCYERELKTKEGLAGTWTLDFVVSKSGEVTTPKATGWEAHDTKLEACLVDRVKAWKFQPIATALPVSKKVKFRPN